MRITEEYREVEIEGIDNFKGLEEEKPNKFKRGVRKLLEVIRLVKRGDKKDLENRIIKKMTELEYLSES